MNHEVGYRTVLLIIPEDFLNALCSFKVEISEILLIY
jgi:hypothetical protein